MCRIFLLACIVGVATVASAQERARPFVTGAINGAKVATSDAGPGGVGFEVTAGIRRWRGIQLFAQGGRDITIWNGAAGARWGLPSAGWLHPYVETSAGVARVMSENVPMSNIGVGAQLHVGRRLTIDAGYRGRVLYGNSGSLSARPYLGAGIRF